MTTLTQLPNGKYSLDLTPGQAFMIVHGPNGPVAVDVPTPPDIPGVVIDDDGILNNYVGGNNIITIDAAGHLHVQPK